MRAALLAAASAAALVAGDASAFSLKKFCAAEPLHPRCCPSPCAISDRLRQDLAGDQAAGWRTDVQLMRELAHMTDLLSRSTGKAGPTELSPGLARVDARYVQALARSLSPAGASSAAQRLAGERPVALGRTTAEARTVDLVGSAGPRRTHSPTPGNPPLLQTLRAHSRASLLLELDRLDQTGAGTVAQAGAGGSRASHATINASRAPAEWRPVFVPSAPAAAPSGRSSAASAYDAVAANNLLHALLRLAEIGADAAQHQRARTEAITAARGYLEQMAFAFAQLFAEPVRAAQAAGDRVVQRDPTSWTDAGFVRQPAGDQAIAATMAELAANPGAFGAVSAECQTYGCLVPDISELLRGYLDASKQAQWQVAAAAELAEQARRAQSDAPAAPNTAAVAQLANASAAALPADASPGLRTALAQIAALPGGQYISPSSLGLYP